MNRTRELRTSALLLALVAIVAIEADAPAAAANRLPVQEEEEIRRLEEWPELSRDERRDAELEIERLQKARTPGMADDAHAKLVATGAGFVPLVLARIERERDGAARERMLAVCDAVTGPAHTRLLAREFAHDSAVVRAWALRRAARYPDAGIRAEAEAALARVRALQEQEDKGFDAEELFLAALATTSSGSLAGLDVVYAEAIEDWKDRGAAIRVAAEAVRGPEATKVVTEHLAAGERARVIGALHLLAGLGSKPEAVRYVKPYLDDQDNGIRIAAINALRGIVDGEPPIEHLPVFEAIELARKWKQKV
jgi:hypothetical protein